MTKKITIGSALRRVVYQLLFILALSSTTIFAQLTGTKTIGGTSPDYVTIKAALQDLQAQGVTAPGVTFLIRDGVYNEDSLVIRTSTTTADAPIVIKPDAGATVTINVMPPSTSFDFAIKVDSTQYVTINGSNNNSSSRDLTINALGVNGRKGVWFNGNCSYGVIKNCIVTSAKDINPPNTSCYGISFQKSGNFYSDYLTIENNLVRYSYTGIYILGAGSLIQNPVISGNIIDSVANTGINISYAEYDLIYDNDINVMRGSASIIYGISLGTYTYKSRIYNNKIHDLNQLSTASLIRGIYLNAGISTAGENSIFNNFLWNLNTPATGTGPINGIDVEGGNATYADTVAYNTVNLTGTSNGVKRTSAFYKGNATGAVYLVNNIFQNTRTDATGSTTTAVYKINTNTTLISDHNNLYVGTPDDTHFTGAIGTADYSTLDDWRAANNSDLSSFAENVPFISDTDLHVRTDVPTQVESGGIPVNGLTTDIDGDIRNPLTPDVGADEGNFIPLDLTAPIIISTSLGNTTDTLSRVAVATITDATGVDVGPGAPRLWYKASTDPSFTPAIADSIVGNSFYFTIPGFPKLTYVQYYIAAQDSAPANNVGTLPSGGSGINPPGSTPPANFFEYYIQSAVEGGTYSVGNGGNYSTLQDAFNSLTLNGIAGPIVLNLTDTVYSAPQHVKRFKDPNIVNTVGEIILNGPIAGSNSTNTITLKPADNVNARIEGSGASVIQLKNASYVIIDGVNPGGTLQSLTIENSSGAGIVLHGNADNDIIKNVTISTNVSFALPRPNAIELDSLTGVGAPDNNLIENNIIKLAFNGISINGGDFVATGNHISNNIIGSTTDSLQQTGIYCQDVSNTIIDHNIIQNVRAGYGQGSGIMVDVKHLNTWIYDNVVHNIQTNYGFSPFLHRYAVGIFVNGNASDNTGGKYYNNMVYDINNLYSGPHSDLMGIYIGDGMNDTLAYNSINISGIDNKDRVSAAIYTGNTTDCVIRDNIAVNSRQVYGTGIAVDIYKSQIGSSMSSNYNDFYVPPDQFGNYIGAITTTNYQTMSDWQTNGYDTNSVNVEPNFITPYLHIDPTIQTPIDGGATPVAGVTTDFDGNIRDASTPDIGADEFTLAIPPSAPTNLVATVDTFMVTLNWMDNSNNEDGFIVERKNGDSTSTNNFIVLDTLIANTTSYVDTSFSVDSLFTYRVYAYNAFGISNYSNLVEVAVPLPVEFVLFTTQISGNNIIVQWTTATETNNKGFEIERKINGQWESVAFKEGQGTTTKKTDYSYRDKFDYKSIKGKIYYRLKQLDFNGTFSYSKAIEVNVDFTPKDYTLYQNYPNPFNPSTTIKYAVPFDSHVRIAIYDILGRLLDVIVNKEVKTGYHDFNWNASNYASGMYIYTINAKSLDGKNSYSSVKKMMLLK